MKLAGPAGRVYAPVGQSRARLCVGRFGAWSAALTAQVREIQRLGPLQARAADPAAVEGSATGWRADPFFWPAVSGPEWELELDEPGGIVWHLSARVAWQGDGLTFKAIGAAHCRPTITGGQHKGGKR